MKKAFQIISMLSYLSKSEHWRGHGVHSPFMYNFVRTTLMKAKKKDNARQYVSTFLKHSPVSLPKSQFGATPESRNTKTSKLTRRMSISPKYGKLLSAIVANYNPRNILELGAGMGVSSFYLAHNETAKLTTVEAMPDYVKCIRETLSILNKKNVTVIEDTFGSFFSKLPEKEKYDLIFIDGAHSYSDTVSNFESTLKHAQHDAFIILDDIRWTKGMFLAWNEVKSNPAVRVSVDLGRIGLLFLNPDLQKQEYTIRY